MTRLYHVHVLGAFGFLKAEDNIESARRWASRAFPRGQVTVTPHYNARICEACDSSPCCCDGAK